ncbi:MAG: tetratricopeptide repeat protein, partial [Spirochaetia bacterium]|nr:tetratricopeptide repeat protein [Spirochaetia bacterium]
IENYSMGFFNMADALRGARQFNRAAFYYEKGLLFFKNAAAYTNLGLAYYYMGDFEKAKKAWLTSIELNPNDPAAYVNAAFAFVNLRNSAEAMKYINMALKLDPNNQNALQLRNSIMAAGGAR